MNMASKNNKKTSLSAGQKVGIGIGVSATMLAAVGGYFLYGSKDAKNNRKTVNSWMLKAKAEVLEGIENAKHLTEEDYENLVDEVMKGYKAARTASVKELGEFGGEMKKYWKQIKGAGPKKAVVKAVKRVVAKAKPKTPSKAKVSTAKKS